MPTETRNRTTTWFVNEDSQTWILANTATIITDSPYGIEDTSDFSEIRILGSVVANETGILMGSANASLFVAQDGSVHGGSTGVEMHEFGGTVVNRGSIGGNVAGISGNYGIIKNFGSIISETAVSMEFGGFVIENHGQIYGWDEGLYIDGPGTIHNKTGGRIEGDEYGIFIDDAATVNVINDGVIRGRDEAAISSGAPVDIRNTGTIIGDIVLGDGFDRIDTRQGIVRGQLIGGQGDDLYLISDSNTRIADFGNSTEDSVRSTASYTLTGGLDHLRLLGDKNIHATGNSGHNDLEGNAGDNTLDGAFGDDWLDGRSGNDILVGGTGTDVFYFEKNSDVDRITDFADGIDKLHRLDVDTQKQFDRLEIRQAGGNTIVNFGDGDRLILENFVRTALGFDDFLVS